MNAALKNNGNNLKTVYTVFALAVFAALFASLGEARPFFFDIDEPKYITAALEMVRSGDWWHPMFGGLPRMEKPPLPYWLVAPLFKLLGTNFSNSSLLFIARIPAILSSVLCVLGTYFIGSRLFSRRTALFAALLLAASPPFKFEGLMLKADIIFTASVTWASYFYLRRFQGDRSFLNLMAGSVALMLGVLTKGPFALPAIGGFLVAEFLRVKKDKSFTTALGETLKKQSLTITLGAALGCGPFLFWLFSTGTGGMDYSTGMLGNFFANAFYKGNPLLFYLNSLGFYVYEAFIVFFPLGGFALCALFSLKGNRAARFSEKGFVLWTCIFYLLLCLVLFRLRAHRYFLPILPFLSLITVNWIVDSVRDRAFKRLCAIGGIITATTAFAGAGWSLYSGEISVNLWKSTEVANFTTQLLPFAAAAIVAGVLIAAVSILRPGKPAFMLSVLFISTLAIYPFYFNAAPGMDSDGNFQPKPLIGHELQEYFANEIPDNCLPVFTDHAARANPDLYFFLRNHDGQGGNGYPARLPFEVRQFNDLLLAPAKAMRVLEMRPDFNPEWPLYKTLSNSRYRKTVLVLSGSELTKLYRNSIFLNKKFGRPAKYEPVQGLNISWDDELFYVVHMSGF